MYRKIFLYKKALITSAVLVVCSVAVCVDGSVLCMTDSVLASWADAIDNTHDDIVDVNSALIDSDLSSEKASTDSSDPDAAFLADADFAVAVARAAELSGMTVVGSTVVDPNTHREKGQ